MFSDAVVGICLGLSVNYKPGVSCTSSVSFGMVALERLEVSRVKALSKRVWEGGSQRSR